MALACGATVEAAARSAGVSKATAFRRLKDPTFCQDLQRMRADMVQRTAGALTAAGGEAVRTLLELMKSANQGATRLGAARSILEIGMKAHEFAELEKLGQPIINWDQLAGIPPPVDIEAVIAEVERQALPAPLVNGSAACGPSA